MKLWVLPLLISLSALPQTFTGSIRGRVTDRTGSVIPKVQVEVVETSTNGVAKSETNEAGDYLVSFLKPSTYTIKFSGRGFKERLETGINLQINASLQIDATLEIGNVTEKVEVSASAVQLDYVSPEIGHVVGEEQLMNLPVIGVSNRGRSPLLLAKLVPGVTSTNFGNINNFSFGGGRPVTNEILVDGLPTTNPSDMTYTLTPSPDVVQEFKVLTTPFSAEYGHTGGGVMMLTTKSGTNSYHFSAYDYLRNRLLNGRNTFSPFKSATKYVQNIPGGTFAGPARFPGYNGKNKTFFFADFSVTLVSSGDAYQAVVPTAAERTGDFSRSVTNTGAAVALFDPSTTRPGADGRSFVRDPFPGGRIPQARFDAVASKIVPFYPESNGTYANFINYYVVTQRFNQTWQWNERIDHIFSENDKMFFRVGGYKPNTDPRRRIPSKANNDNGSGWRDTQLALSETHVFSPRMVNDLRIGFIQEANFRVGADEASGELGLKGVILNSFPIVTVSYPSWMQLGANANNRDRNRTYSFSEALTLQNGRHSLKMGGDYRWMLYHSYDPGKLSGSYAFGSTFTANPGAANTGYAFADMLLGYPASTSININDYTYRLNILAAGAYIQDDFKIRRDLTVNLGLRWEFAGPYIERTNQYANFNPTRINRQTNTPGEVDFAGRDGAPSHFGPNIYRNFLPRIGFAWGGIQKTVVRGGYGLYRLPSTGYVGYWPVSQYSTSASFTSLDSVTPRYQLANGVPAYSANVDAQGNPRIAASVTAPSAVPLRQETRDRTPYNQNWQFGIQRQIRESWLVEVDYQANRGVKLPIALGLNQLRPEQFSLASSARLQLPFPQYANVQALSHDGNSTYHSMQAKVERRFKAGYMISIGYTWSKLLDDVDGPARTNGVSVQNIYNLRAERGLGGYDTPHRLVANYVWNVPIGRDGKILNRVPVVKEILGGWRLSGITEYQVGLPMTVSQPNNFSGGFTQVQRPNRIADPVLPRADRTLTRWFNTDAFAVTPQLTLGNSPRFPLHGPGVENWDVIIDRTFKFREHLRLDFRTEFYNAMNHANYNNPNTQLTARNFGVITAARDARVVQFSFRIFY